MRWYGGSGPPNRSEIFGELAAGARAAWPKDTGVPRLSKVPILVRYPLPKVRIRTASYLTVPYLIHAPYYLHSSYLNVDTFLIQL